MKKVDISELLVGAVDALADSPLAFDRQGNRVPFPAVSPPQATPNTWGLDPDVFALLTQEFEA